MNATSPPSARQKPKSLLHSKDFWLYLLAFGIGCVTFYLIHFKLEDDREIDEAQSWTPTAAHVREARIRTVTPGGRRSAQQRFLHVRFSYEYGGETHVSTEAGWYTEEDTKAALHAFRWNPGELVCYVNPSRPEEAVLFRNTEKRSGSFLIAAAAVGLVFTVGGALGIWSAARKQKKAS